jgi:large subunit ribosomal protein L7/L12
MFAKQAKRIAVFRL